MLAGLILILLTGLAWGGCGVVLSYVSSRETDLDGFSFLAATVGTLACWVIFPEYAKIAETGISLPVIKLAGLMMLAGAFARTGLLFMQYAMKHGNHSVSWSIGQSALVLPFLSGLILFGNRCAWWQGIGVALITGGLSLFGIAGKNTPAMRHPRQPSNSRSREPGYHWILLALLAFLLLGSEQTLKTIPSVFPGWDDTYGLRIPMASLGGFLACSGIMLARKARPVAKHLKPALGLVMISLPGQWMLFKALDTLGARQMAGIVFPAAVGICILTFSAYCRFMLHEKNNRAGSAGIALVTAGIVLVALK